MRAIIPCAGYGTRMNMKPDQSKEMLLDPFTKRPMIEYAIKLCTKYGLDPLVVTRVEKADLLGYCEEHGISTWVIEPKGEWVDTVLASKAMWHTTNFLILPDTRFTPTDIIADMKKDMELGASSSIALHEVEDGSKWCMVSNYSLTEKPPRIFAGMAMGVMAFNNVEGEQLFNIIKTRSVETRLFNSSFRYLSSFKDITRTGKIES